MGRPAYHATCWSRFIHGQRNAQRASVLVCEPTARRRSNADDARTGYCVDSCGSQLTLRSGARRRLGDFAPAEDLPPKVLEPIRRQLGIRARVLDVFVAEIGLQGAGTMLLVGQRQAASMAQLVGGP